MGYNMAQIALENMEDQYGHNHSIQSNGCFDGRIPQSQSYEEMNVCSCYWVGQLYC